MCEMIGAGTGGRPMMGEEAGQESQEELKEILQEADMVSDPGIHED